MYLVPSPRRPHRRLLRSVSTAVLSLALAALSLAASALPASAAPGDLDPSFIPKPGLTGQTTTLGDGRILALGDYVDGADGAGITLVRLQSDGTTDASFQAPFNEFSTTLQQFALDSQGRILVGGGIPRGQGTAKSFVRLLPDGASDPSFNLAADGQPTTFVLQGDGRFIFNGASSAQTSTYRTNYTRVNSDGSIDTGYKTDSSLVSAVTAGMALQPDGKLVVVGTLSFFSGSTVDNRLLIRLNTDGSTDTGFSGPAGIDPFRGGGDAVAVQADGKILASGALYSSDFVGTAFLRRYNANGLPDTSFREPTFAPTPGQNGVTRARVIRPLASGKILVGGIFGSVNGVARVNVVRLNADGSVDTSFVSPAAFVGGAGVEVLGLSLQPDGRILVGGKLYATSDAQGRTTIYGLVRLLNDEGDPVNPPAVPKAADLRADVSGAKAKVKADKVVLKASLVVTNAGKKKARGVTAAVYLSADAALDAQDALLGVVDLAALGYPELGKKSATDPLPLKYKLRGGQTASGKYLIVQLDPGGSISETDETNNVAVVPVP